MQPVAQQSFTSVLLALMVSDAPVDIMAARQADTMSPLAYGPQNKVMKVTVQSSGFASGATLPFCFYR